MSIARKLAVALFVVGALACSAEAASLVWTGAAGDNDWATAGNWDTGTAPGTTSGSPDSVTFGIQGIDSAAHTIGGNPLYLNAITIGADGSPPDFATSTKYLANATTGGKIVLQADGAVTPTITAYMLDGDSPTATRTLRITTPIELQADTYVKRTGTALPNTRTLQLAGPISGTGNLTLESGNGSYTTAIHLAGDNSFVGDVTVIGGSNLTIEHVNALGNPANQLSFTNGGGCVFTFGALADGSTIFNDIELATDGSAVNPYWSWNDGTPSNRDVTLAGNITGGRVNSNVLCFFSRDWRRVFLAGDSSFYGNMRITAGSEVIVAGANASNVALGNVGAIIFNEGASSSLPPEATTAMLAQGSYTLNTDFRITNVNVAGTSMAPVVSIGQMNDGTTGYDAVFTGNIQVQEDDYRALNLYAEEGGSARFSGNVYGTSGLGFSVNRSFDEIEGVAAGTRRYGNSTGTVMFDAASCVALTNGGTESIGSVSAEHGILQIDTEHFYASTLTIASDAALTGSGRVSAHVALSGQHAPGNSVGTQTLGSATWEPGGSLELEVNDAAGSAGTGWDLVILGDGAGAGTLDLTGLSLANPFEIRLVSLDDTVAGDAANFASTEPCDWMFITYGELVDIRQNCPLLGWSS